MAKTNNTRNRKEVPKKVATPNKSNYAKRNSNSDKNNLTSKDVDSIQESKVPFSHIFMDLAVSVSRRSADATTGVGCVLVNQYNHILGIGCNAESKMSSVKDANANIDELMVHAEANALSQANCTLSREEIYVFVTRQPCEQCMKHLAQFNIKAIFYLVYGGYNSFVIANHRNIPMIQYTMLFKYESSYTVIDSFHGDHRNQEVSIVRERRLKRVGMYKEDISIVKAEDTTQCIVHEKCIMTCSDCAKDVRNKKTPPAISISTSTFNEWCDLFKVNNTFRMFN